jgi:hypothetical protein
MLGNGVVPQQAVVALQRLVRIVFEDELDRSAER